jgi:hypothetical protein
VSILSSFPRGRHLDDTAIAELWCARATAGPPDGSLPEAAHIETCGTCRARYDAYVDWLSDARVDALGEADDIFTAERFGAQQAHILRRLETLERPARVIAFPRFPRSVTASRRGPHRWIAAAAAASFIVGLGAGELLDFRRTLRVATPADLAPVTHTARGGLQPINLSSDDMLLYDSEAVSAEPAVEALHALDALTPRLRDLDQAR